MVANPPVLTIAADAVHKLNIGPFIESNLPLLFQKLEECDANVTPASGDMMFIALSVPLINGIIHIASNRTALDEATYWVVNTWKNEQGGPPDTISILSGLVLIYVADRGWQTYNRTWEEYQKAVQEDQGRPMQSNLPEVKTSIAYKQKQEIWQRIHDRVNKLSEEIEL